MPQNWKTYRLGEIASDIAMGPFGSNIKRENFVDSGVPVIRGTNLNRGRFINDEFIYLTEKKLTHEVEAMHIPMIISHLYQYNAALPASARHWMIISSFYSSPDYRRSLAIRENGKSI